MTLGANLHPRNDGRTSMMPDIDGDRAAAQRRLEELLLSLAAWRRQSSPPPRSHSGNAFATHADLAATGSGGACSAVAPVIGELTSDAEDGRGLQIIQQSSARWGIDSDGAGGKRVWAELSGPASQAR